MKKLVFNLLVFLICLSCFAQDTQPPTTPTNFQFISNPTVQPDNVSVEWEHGTDNVGVTTYEIYINGILEEIIPYDGSSTVQYAPFLYFNNGTYCLTILARDAAGNASPLSDQICKYVNVIYQNTPRKPYISGLLNFAGDDKAIEIANLSFQDADLSDYSIKISYDGNATWDTVYTFPANMILAAGETYVIAHSNISICTSEIDEYNSAITNFDGNDVIGLFKYDILYDAVGEWGNPATVINTDNYITREFMSTAIPSTSFNINTWVTIVSNGSCPAYFGSTFLIVLNTEDQELSTFQMYPNPIVTNTLQFNTKNNQTIDSISILDINGRTVLQSSNITNNQLDIQVLKQGVYFVKTQAGNKTSTHKLIRQ